MKLAIIHKEKCKPAACGSECKKYCPVEKKEQDSCVTIEAKSRIEENTCVGCAICVKRCPFGAIDIINLPSAEDRDLVHRYGQNGFALYGLPVPRSGSVLGLLGRNGIGKTTAVNLLAGHEKINLGQSRRDDPKGPLLTEDVKKFFKGNEILRYFEDLDKKTIAYKPQNLSKLVVDITVRELLHERGESGQIRQLAEHIGIAKILDNKMNKLSGGELQKVAILAASLGNEDIYFFDEPLAYLDIAERLRISDFIKEIGKDRTVVVVEHDLLILDYLTDFLNVFYGGQGAFGTVSGVKASKYGVNSYLAGFLKEENLRIRDKALNFNFTKNALMSGNVIAEWPDFSVKFGDGAEGAPPKSDSGESLPSLAKSAEKTGEGLGGDNKASLAEGNSDGFVLNVKGGKIHQNHVIGILGRNGTGKTTFVRALAGELEVMHGGHEIGNREHGKKGHLDLGLEVSYKPQYLFTEKSETVKDICFKEKINRKMMSVFNLGTIQGKKICELSGGELQRFSIARCLAKEADVYLIDEPSAYLDVEERISVAKAIKDLMVEKERTAFVVDHDLLLVSYLADSVINFEGEGGVKGEASEVRGFEEGVSKLLESLDVTLRKDEESGRPRINKKGSVKDREQKEKGKWAIF